MEHFWGLIDSGTYRVIMLTIHLLEAMGFVVILASALKAFVGYWTNKNGDPFRSCRLSLADGLATGLEFKLGGEILRTLVVRDMQEIAVLGAIVALRVAMALMIYWEIKQEKSMGDHDSA